jgi:hypothetical protein
MYARLINPIGSFTSGETTERNIAAGIRMAAIGAAVLASHFQNGESIASSTYLSMTSDRTRYTLAWACPRAPEIVPQRIAVVPRYISSQKTAPRKTSLHHRRKNGEKDSSEHFRFSRHVFSWEISRKNWRFQRAV